MLRPHIAVFGCRNAGKSSLINALTRQQTTIVSDTPGTTTDPIKKVMELNGIGPVVWIDTAGIDDDGALGAQRVARTKDVIKEIDLALLLFTRNNIGPHEQQLMAEFERSSLPFILVHNKSDEIPLDLDIAELLSQKCATDVCECSAKSGDGIEILLELVRQKIGAFTSKKKSLLGNLISKNKTVVLVCPIDSETPDGRLIFPQVQTIRDILDHQAIAVVLTEVSFPEYMKKNDQVDLVISDSQIFDKVEQFVPTHIPFTGFSILLAHRTGLFSHFLRGTHILDCLQDGDKVLILESCTHHVTCEDIGRVKLPNRIKSFTGADIHFEWINGLDPLFEKLDGVSLVVQCGGCMVTQKQLAMRISAILELGVPITNYGMALAYMSDIFERTVAPFIDEH